MKCEQIEITNNENWLKTKFMCVKSCILHLELQIPNPFLWANQLLVNFIFVTLTTTKLMISFFILFVNSSLVSNMNRKSLCLLSIPPLPLATCWTYTRHLVKLFLLAAWVNLVKTCLETRFCRIGQQRSNSICYQKFAWYCKLRLEVLKPVATQTEPQHPLPNASTETVTTSPDGAFQNGIFLIVNACCVYFGTDLMVKILLNRWLLQLGTYSIHMKQSIKKTMPQVHNQ